MPRLDRRVRRRVSGRVSKPKKHGAPSPCRRRRRMRRRRARWLFVINVIGSRQVAIFLVRVRLADVCRASEHQRIPAGGLRRHPRQHPHERRACVIATVAVAFGLHVHAARSPPARGIALIEDSRLSARDSLVNFAPRGSDRPRLPVASATRECPTTHPISKFCPVSSPCAAARACTPTPRARITSRTKSSTTRSTKRSPGTPRKSTSSCTRTTPCPWRTMAAACRWISTRKRR